MRAARSQTQARLASLEHAFDELVAYSDGTPPDDEHDPEGATVGWERAQLRAVLEQTRHQLIDLDDALKRLAAGAYGRCERCGNDIDPDRLAARPATRTCLSCASKRLI